MPRVRSWPWPRFPDAQLSAVLAPRLALLAAAAALAGAVDPGAGTRPRTEFVPPAPGTYTLERIQPAGNAVLLDPLGHAGPLARFVHGKVTLLTFFYTYCVDPLGCPFAHETLGRLRERVLGVPGLASRVRFVNVSLDPVHDTPEALRAYAGPYLQDAHFEWRFLTAASVPALLPLLEDFGQDVSVEADEQGRPTRALHHMLKVFLIDRDGEVREIYSLAYLQPEVMFNDILTLAQAAPSRCRQDRDRSACERGADR